MLIEIDFFSSFFFLLVEGCKKGATWQLSCP